MAHPAYWWMLLALGGVTVAVGVAMLLWPAASLRTVAVIIGVWLVVAGLVRLVGALLDRSMPREHQRLSALVALACVAGGVTCLADPSLTLGLLAFVLALQWLVGGVVDVVRGLRSGRRERRWLIALGAASCLAGAAFVVWPALSLVAFNALAAFAAIGVGVLDVIAALRLRGREE